VEINTKIDVMGIFHVFKSTFQVSTSEGQPVDIFIILTICEKSQIKTSEAGSLEQCDKIVVRFTGVVKDAAASSSLQFVDIDDNFSNFVLLDCKLVHDNGKPSPFFPFLF
jgi:hypothetical protein